MKALLILCLFLSSCSKASNQDTLRMNLGTEPPSLDWNIASDSTSFDVISNIMIGLTRFGMDTQGKLTIEPGIAESWTISDNATKYVFHLNPQAKWTDDKQVTSQEFLDSIKRILDPNTAAPYAELLSMIDLTETKTPDDTTLIIKLKHPAPYFIYLTAFGPMCPIRLDIIKQYGKNWTEPRNIVSNGPFKLIQWQHEYKILLERNESFYLSKPHLKFLKYFMVPEQSSAFTLFKNNQLDWIDSRSIPTSELRKLKHPQRFALMRNTFIGFNCTKAPFNNVLVRKAFAYAIDRDALVKIKAKGDLANDTWIPPSLSEFLDQQIINQDATHCPKSFCPKQARELLLQAGYPNGKNFPELEFLIPSREDARLLAETLQAMWAKELNIRVHIRAMEWKTFLSTLNSNPPDIFRLNWGADFPDPDTFMGLFVTNHEMNKGHFSDQQYNNLVKEAASTVNFNKRKELYTKAEKILTRDQMAITPLYIDSQIILHQPNIKGLRVLPLDIVFLDQVSK